MARQFACDLRRRCAQKRISAVAHAIAVLLIKVAVGAMESFIAC